MIRFLTGVVCLALALPARTRADEPKPKGPPADELLAAGLARAKADHKAVFLSFGSPTCGWCKYLDRYHARPAVEKLLNKHLVFVKVDVVENPGGQELYRKYVPAGEGGVPVWVILGADGAVRADSFGPGAKKGQANVGFPAQPNELAHYAKALRKAVPDLTEDQVSLLLRELEDTRPKKKKN